MFWRLISPYTRTTAIHFFFTLSCCFSHWTLLPFPTCRVAALSLFPVMCSPPSHLLIITTAYITALLPHSFVWLSNVRYHPAWALQPSFIFLPCSACLPPRLLLIDDWLPTTELCLELLTKWTIDCFQLLCHWVLLLSLRPCEHFTAMKVKVFTKPKSAEIFTISLEVSDSSFYKNCNKIQMHW